MEYRKWKIERGVEEKGNEGRTKKRKWVTNKKKKEKSGNNVKQIKTIRERREMNRIRKVGGNSTRL
jgi:hypothetical protein